MYSIRETALFQKQVKEIWNEEERLEFFSYISQNPFAGDVVTQSGGMRKIRWQASGQGKRGGARVIYLNLLDIGMIEMVMIYEKKNTSNILGKVLSKFKEQ